MLATRAADASVPIVYVNLVGGQDELVFDGASIVFDEQGRLVARARQFAEDLLVVDLDVRPTFRKRLLDPRGRWSAPALPEVKVSDAHLGERARAASRRARASPRFVRSTRRSRSAPATTSSRTGSPTSSSACPAASTRRSWPPSPPTPSARAGARRARCRRASRAKAASPTPRQLAAEPRHPDGHRADRGGPRRVPRHARRAVRGHRARSGRGEPPGPDPGDRAHGALEQVRLARADHRQQERDRHRLLDALRRHGRRVRGDQGRAEDARVRARPGSQRARRARADPRIGARQAAERRAPARPDATATRCRTTHCSTRSSRATSKATCRWPSWRRPGSIPTRCAGSPGSSTATSTSAARRRRACASRPRRSARTGACRSRTAGLVDTRDGSDAFYPELALVVASFLYGATFTIVQDALDDVTATGFVLVRFAIGGAALAALRAPPRVARAGGASDRLGARPGSACGVALGVTAFVATCARTSACSTRPPRTRRSSPGCSPCSRRSSSASSTAGFRIGRRSPRGRARRRRPVPPHRRASSTLGFGDALTLVTAVCFGIWFVQHGCVGEPLRRRDAHRGRSC